MPCPDFCMVMLSVSTCMLGYETHTQTHKYIIKFENHPKRKSQTGKGKAVLPFPKGEPLGPLVACATWVPVLVPHAFMLTDEIPPVDRATGLVS